MLITDKNAAQINLMQIVRNGIAFLSIGAFLYFFAYPALILFNDTDSDIILCDAEKTFRGDFISNGKRFTGGDFQRETYANSGKYSCFLYASKKAQYALGYDLKVEPNDIYEYSVWYYQDNGNSPAYIVASNDKAKYYKAADKVKTTNKRGWSQLIFKDTIPATFEEDQLKVYVYTNGGTDTYFDDLQIRKIEAENKLATSLAFQPKAIYLLSNDPTNLPSNESKHLSRSLHLLIFPSPKNLQW